MLDRLVLISMPDLHAHFKDEGVASSLYSSAWFITLFTNTLTNQGNSNLSPKLLEFWDHFVIEGYDVMFKICVSMLAEFEDEMLGMSFEYLLNFVVEIPRILFHSNDTEMLT